MSNELFKRINAYLNQPIRNKHVKYGLPFLAFMAVALTILSQVGTVRYQFRKTKTVDREELRSLGYKVNERPQTLEEAYENIKDMDIDNWKNIRGPRLWDETPSS